MRIKVLLTALLRKLMHIYQKSLELPLPAIPSQLHIRLPQGCLWFIYKLFPTSHACKWPPNYGTQNGKHISCTKFPFPIIGWSSSIHFLWKRVAPSQQHLCCVDQTNFDNSSDKHFSRDYRCAFTISVQFMWGAQQCLTTERPCRLAPAQVLCTVTHRLPSTTKEAQCLPRSRSTETNTKCNRLH